MKESIEYYYNLTIDELFIEKDVYHFKMGNRDFYFNYFSRDVKDLEDIIKCNIELKNHGINTHIILRNINNEYLTKIEDQNYILIEVINKGEIISISDIIDYNRKFILIDSNNLYRNNWSYLWQTKIDYIESQLKEIKTNIIVENSIDYYIGLAENAIYYVNIIEKKYPISNLDKIVLSRKRIYFPNYKLNYLNPLSFIFDLEVRDVAEYIKSYFFAGENALVELETFLKSIHLTTYSYNMLFARLLYPSYYFDIYEKIVNTNDKSEKLLKIISLNVEYEKFLKKAYELISSYAPLENIEWLKN